MTDRDEMRDDRRTFAVAAAATATALAIVFLLAPARFHFWYDSWTYYELARSVGRDFYAVSTIREFQTNAHYSSAFPPLWPLIIALFARSGFGMLGSYIASFVSFGLFALSAEAFASRLFARRGIGLLSALLLLTFPGMRWDLAGGGSVALYLCSIAVLGRLFLDLDVRSSRHAALIGAIAGGMVMLRFDALPAALVALAAAVVLGMRGRRILVLGAIFVLCLSPWIAYSWSHFHQPFVTDNRAVALAIDPDAYVMDYLPTPRPGLRDDPGAWVGKLFVHVPIVGRALLDAILRSVFFVPVWLAALAMLFFGRRAPVTPVDGLPAIRDKRAWIALLAVSFAPIAAYIVTGYQESRYFSTFVWLGELAALGLLITASPARARLLVTSLICIAGLAKSASLARYVADNNPITVMRAQLSTADADSVVDCLRSAQARPGDGILFLTNTGYLNSYRFGALTGWRTAPPPRNWGSLSPEQRAEFTHRYHLTFVLDTLPAANDRLPSAALPTCPMAVRRLTGLTS